MSAFKAYDIRGVWNEDLTEDLVYNIGRCLPKLLESKEVAIGRDVRTSSPTAFKALCDGITDAGADVLDLGLTTTPMTYFATGFLKLDASVQITASHNPAKYNGLKVSKTDVLPVGYDAGLNQIEKWIEAGEVPAKAATKGQIRSKDIRQDYIASLKPLADKISDKLKLVIDISNGMAGIVARQLFGDKPVYLFEEPDGTFPNHEANPLKEENVEDLKKAVAEHKADLGVIFDGDADRVMFVDEKGRFMQPDLVIALIARAIAAEGNGKLEGVNVLQDIRTSRSVTEELVRLGANPHFWKVGHAFAKLKMAELDCLIGGELAGHYYYKEFYNCDDGVLTALNIILLCDKLKAEGKLFSEVVDELITWSSSGELNFVIEAKAEAMEDVVSYFRAKNPITEMDFDGYRLEWEDEWFNIRPSNTEPYLRVVAEASSAEKLDALVGEIKGILAKYQ